MNKNYIICIVLLCSLVIGCKTTSYTNVFRSEEKMDEEYNCFNSRILNQAESIIPNVFDDWDIIVGLEAMCMDYKSRGHSFSNRQNHYRCSIFNKHRTDSTKHFTELGTLSDIVLEDYITIDSINVELYPSNEIRKSYIDSTYVNLFTSVYKPRLSVITEEIKISKEIEKVKITLTANHFSMNNVLLETKDISLFLYRYDTTGMHEWSFWDHKD